MTMMPPLASNSWRDVKDLAARVRGFFTDFIDRGSFRAPLSAMISSFFLLLLFPIALRESSFPARFRREWKFLRRRGFSGLGHAIEAD
jgi:hypothetical protein